MKYKVILVSFFCLLSVSAYCQNSKVSISPEKPMPGEEITITYSQDIDSPFFLLTPTLRVYDLHYPFGFCIEEIKMKKNGGGYQIKYLVPEKALCLRFQFFLFDRLDNNSDKGYFSLLHNDRGEALELSRSVLARQLISSSSALSDRPPLYLQKNRKLADSLFKKEIELNPKILLHSNPESLILLTQLSSELGHQEIYDKIYRILDTVNIKEIKNSELLFDWWRLPHYFDDHRDQEFSKQLKKITSKEEKIAYNLANKIKNPSGVPQSNDILRFESGYDTLLSQMAKDGVYFDLSSYYYGVDEWGKFITYSNKIQDKTIKAQLYRSAAMNYAGYFHRNNNRSFKKAELLIKEAMHLIRQKEFERPCAWPYGMHTKNIQREYGSYAEIYADILSRQQNFVAALRNQAIAVMTSNFENENSVNTYISYYEKLFGQEKTISLIEKLILTSKSNDLLETYYIQVQSHLLGGKKQAFEHLEELKKKAAEISGGQSSHPLVNLPAPDFTLPNLRGDSIRLSQFHGKTVVLNFWAPWSNPSIQSLPGIQLAATEMEVMQNDSVVFLTIYTLNQSGNPQKKAAKVIEENGFSLEVLLDDAEQTLLSYGISGLPTRVIISPDGYVRFVESGYRGDPILLKEEILMWVDLAKEIADN